MGRCGINSQDYGMHDFQLCSLLCVQSCYAQ
jgi:hypothetical protein